MRAILGHLTSSLGDQRFVAKSRKQQCVCVCGVWVGGWVDGWVAECAENWLSADSACLTVNRW